MKRIVFMALMAGCPAVPVAAETEADVFLSLCVHGGYSPLSGERPRSFPDAVPVTGVVSGLPTNLPMEVLEAWNLVPDPTSAHQAVVVAGTLDHPGLGPSSTCTVLFRWALTSDLREGLLAGGAEEDSGFFFAEGEGRLWMITATGMPESPTGEGIIMGMTPNVPPTN